MFSLISLNQPSYLILLLIPLAVLFWEIKNRNFKTLPKTPFILKLVLTSLLILAITNPAINLKLSQGELIILLDESRSVKDLIGDPNKLIAPLLPELAKNNHVTTISFAGRTSLSQKGLTPSINDEETNIEQALRVIKDLNPQGVLLITDALETKGQISHILPEFNQDQIPLYLYPLMKEYQETFLERVEIPVKIFRNKPFTIKVDIYSTLKTNGLLEIKKFSPTTSEFQTLSQKELLLLKGSNSFSFPMIAEGDSSYQQFKIILKETKDTWIQNNEYDVSTYLADSLPLLLIKGIEVKTNWIEEALRQQGFTVNVRTPEKLPYTLEGLLEYKGLILQDVAAEDLKLDQVKLLTRYLKEQGRGLITIGGRRSFGLGGYKGSLLEEILPVVSEVKVPHRIPEVALCVVLDTSGSMATEGRYGTKLDMARTAAIRVLNVLSTDDLFAFVGFHSRADVVFPFSYPSDKSVIEKELGKLIAGGGTNIIAGLKEGVKLFQDIEATNKQLLLISDGIAPEEGLEEVLQQLRELKVEVISIGVGMDANLEFLRKITAPWGGKVYYSIDGESIPEISAKEVGKLKASFIYLKPFVPTVSLSHPILKNIKEDLFQKAPLSGYLRTTLKDGSQTILATPLGEPLLAIKMVGLGKSLAFTADGEGRLSGKFLNSPAFSLLLGGMVREVFLKEQGDIDVAIEGNEVKVTFYVDPPLPLGVKLETMLWRGDYYKSQTYPLERVSLNRFEVKLPPLNTGSYFLRIQDDNQKFYSEGSFIIPYPQEYRVFAESFTLSSFQKVSGVTIVENLDELKNLKVASRKVSHSLTPYLILLSLILFFLDLLVRKIGLRLIRPKTPKTPLPSKREQEKKKRFLDFLRKPWVE